MRREESRCTLDFFFHFRYSMSNYMAYIKSQKEIKRIVEGGKIMGEILDALIPLAVPGASAFDIDIVAEKLIREAGGIPAFKGYKAPGHTPFPSTICASLNAEVVHGIATKDKIMKSGDVFSIDIGMQWPANSKEGKKGNGYFTDTAVTICVGNVSKEVKQLVERTRESLEQAIDVCMPGNSIAHIGAAVEDYIEQFKYGIVAELVGHGVGNEVHEDPHVPNYHTKEMEEVILAPGLVIAIEPMITLGNPSVETAKDGWAIVTRDRSVSSHSEHTVVITEDGPLVVTRRPSEKKK